MGFNSGFKGLKDTQYISECNASGSNVKEKRAMN